MTRLALAQLLTALWLGCAHAQQTTGTAETSRLQPNTINRYDNTGQFRGQIQQNPFLNDRLDVYDKDGNRTGFVERSPFLGGTYREFGDVDLGDGDE